MNRAKQYMDSSLIGTIVEGKVNIGSFITFATVQTVSNMDLTRYRDLWDVIIVDECHRVSGSPTSVTRYQKVLNNLSARHKFGLSATVHRSDGMIQATYALLGTVTYEVPTEAITGKLMNVKVQPVGTRTDITAEALNEDGTLNHARLLNYLSTNVARNRIIVNKIIENEGESCIILSDRLEQLAILMDELPQQMKEEAVLISGKMTSKSAKEARERALDEMRTGEKKYLFATYALCKEGLDIPRLSRLFLATPQSDYAVMVQSVGRIARTCEGKKDAIAYDFVDGFRWAIKKYKSRCTIYRETGVEICE
jgi:superfamily II DNA or RNA helicase